MADDVNKHIKSNISLKIRKIPQEANVIWANLKVLLKLYMALNHVSIFFQHLVC